MLLHLVNRQQLSQDCRTTSSTWDIHIFNEPPHVRFRVIHFHTTQSISAVKTANHKNLAVEHSNCWPCPWRVHGCHGCPLMCLRVVSLGKIKIMVCASVSSTKCIQTAIKSSQNQTRTSFFQFCHKCPSVRLWVIALNTCSVTVNSTIIPSSYVNFTCGIQALFDHWICRGAMLLGVCICVLFLNPMQTLNLI